MTYALRFLPEVEGDAIVRYFMIIENRKVGNCVMQNVTIQITEEELSRLLQPYQTLQAFLEKFTSPNELSRADFLNGLKEAQDDVKAGRLEEVRSLENFAR